MPQVARRPGPDHPITIAPSEKRFRITAGGHVVADGAEALVLREASYPPVVYIRRQDVDMTQLLRTERKTFCPYKGACSYFSIPAAGSAGENAVWSYETPFEAVAPIREALAFYPDRVEITETASA